MMMEIPPSRSSQGASQAHHVPLPADPSPSNSRSHHSPSPPHYSGKQKSNSQRRVRSSGLESRQPVICPRLDLETVQKRSSPQTPSLDYRLSRSRHSPSHIVEYPRASRQRASHSQPYPSLKSDRSLCRSESSIQQVAELSAQSSLKPAVAAHGTRMEVETSPSKRQRSPSPAPSTSRKRSKLTHTLTKVLTSPLKALSSSLKTWMSTQPSSEHVPIPVQPISSPAADNPPKATFHPSPSHVLDIDRQEQTELSQTDVSPLDSQTVEVQILRKCGFRILESEQPEVVVCQSCRHGLLASGAYDHARKKHGVKLSRTEQTDLDRVFKKHAFAAEIGDLRVRSFGEAPLEGINIEHGFACDEHREAWSSEKQSDAHTAAGCPNVVECQVQSLLLPHFRKGAFYVRVDPSASTAPEGDNDSYAAFMRTWAIQLRERPLAILGPIDDNDIREMEKKTQWLSHLKPHITDRVGVTGVMALVKPKLMKSVPKYVFGAAVVAAYVTKGCKIINAAEANVRYTLKEYPRTAQTEMLKVPSSETVNKYRDFLWDLTFALITSLDSPQTKYRFPLTVLEQQTLCNLCQTFEAQASETDGQDAKQQKAIQQKAIQLIPQFHDCIKVFLMTRDNLPDLETENFGSVLQCFLAVRTLRNGGLSCSPAAAVHLISGLKFIIRLCVAVEAEHIIKSGSTSEPFHGIIAKCLRVVTRLAKQNLNRNVNESEFTKLCTVSAYATTIAFKATIAPMMHRSPDFMTFTYDTTTVHLPDLRHGFRTALVELGRLFEVLKMGLEVSYTPPRFWVDVWPSTEGGDSFLKRNKFFDDHQHPWLTALLKSKKHSLLLTRSDGILCQDKQGYPILNDALVNTIFKNHRNFLHHLMVLLYMTAAGDRGTEYIMYRLLNGLNARSVLISASGELILTPRHKKTDAITGEQLFIPSCTPDAVNEIMKEYLILIRPVIDTLYRMRVGNGQRAVIQTEFLWASEGKYPTESQFGRILEDFTYTYCGRVKIGRRAWRQIITEILRTYSKYDVSDEENKMVFIHDARMGHSSKTSHKHYGSREQIMSTEVLDAFMNASRDLHDILGVGRCPDVFPIARDHRLREHAQAVSGESSRSPHALSTYSGPSSQESVAVAIQTLIPLFRESLRKEVVTAMAEFATCVGPGHSLAMPTPRIMVTHVAPTPSLRQGEQPLWRLRSLLRDSTAAFRSNEQHKAIELSLEGNTSFMALLRPGEGKSLVYQIPASCQPGKTLVICCRSALLVDQLKRAEGLGIPSFQWTSDNVHIPPGTKLVFVALESFSAGFSTFCQDPDFKRVVVDEIHEFLTAQTWRPRWKDLAKYLTTWGVQIILCSGSVPCGYESHLLYELGFRISIPMIRSPVHLPAHRFVHLRLPDGVKVADFICPFTRYLYDHTPFMTPSDQGIVFYPTVQAVTAAVGTKPLCASWADFKHKNEHESEWLRGTSRPAFMHATTTCILGLDNPNCNVVIFAQFDPSLVDIVQGAARGGRRGQPTLVVFLTSHHHQYSAGKVTRNDDPECRILGTQLLNSTDGCIRRYIGTAFNGKDDSCDTIADALRCQRCASDGIFSDLRHFVETFSTNRNSSNPERFANPVHVHQNPSRSLSKEKNSQNHAIPGFPESSQIPGGPAPPALATSDFNSLRTIEFQVAMRQADDAMFARKLKELANLSKSLIGQCGVCWAITGKRFTNHHSAFGSCTLGHLSDAKDNYEFRNWKPTFKRHTACFSCFMPQVDGSANERELYVGDRTPHPVPGKGDCVHPHLFKHIAWTVFKTPKLWMQFNQSTFGPHSDMMTFEDFAEWAAKLTGGMVNIGHLVHWLITYHK
ncbi:hypothetical protein R3P38DRAFT_2805917 [Favolaschia claudopus]|uniref:DNA 3'-5' helicase n=1 Tax=Favolaschia claudopus TaxID=2862362 RepID=A0AAV9ZM22_9AGAR